ncbi:amino acid permease, partial [Peribacillus frigoritolerans]|uniref:amino acid permease n=3 Tax=Bacillaceae TaxID=186817 RepID=UPI00339173F3
MPNTNDTNENQLKRSMKSRHLFMISLGGVIGTGLFLSSGYTISQAGPGGTILAYLVGGLIMYLVMLCLGELTVAMPVTGSFQTYATKYIGPATGFTIGLMYWLTWVVTVGSEFTASGLLMQRWFPNTSVWMWSAVFAILIFLLNSFSVKIFAETEFWFSGIKIITIILFIVLGGSAMLGFIPMDDRASAPMLSNFTADGGLFPNGLLPVFMAMISVNFAFSGTELIGIAAGESENPEKDVPRSIRNVIWRTMFFFVGAIFVLSGLISWEEAGVIESPFVMVFDNIGIPYAADIMNFVIITALLSVANSGLYAST